MAAAFVAAALLAPVAEGAPVRLKQIGKASSAGDFAIATADGSAARPRALFVRVLASPNQSVSVNWIVTCSRGFAAIGSRSGDFEARSPVTRKLRMPFRKADDCDVIASAANDPFGPGGRITIILLADV